MEGAFQARDIARISNIIVGMKRSLMVLTDVPDYADRQQLVHVLENRLEAQLAPMLVDAFNAHDLGLHLSNILLPTDILCRVLSAVPVCV